MIEIDGSVGGGQLVRTAVSLSALSGTPVRVTGIREARPQPGLRPQHLAAVRAAAEACDAAVTGATEDSDTFAFRPDRLGSGSIEVDVGSAGSLMLVFDTLLPLAVGLDGTLSVRAQGGTDVAWSPSLDYYRGVKLPLLRRYGLACALDGDRRGFYPAGGGSATLQLAPSSPEPVRLETPASVTGARVHAVATPDLAEREVAERGVDRAVEGLASAGIETEVRSATYAAADSTGAVLLVRLDATGSIAGFDALGEQGVPMEEVADRAVDDATAFAAGDGAVDRHLADQLVVFLALAGGRVRLPAVTDHVESSCAVVEAFGGNVAVESADTTPELVGRRVEGLR